MKGRADYGTLGKREGLNMVLWGEGKGCTLGRREGLTMVLWGTLGEGKG